MEGQADNLGFCLGSFSVSGSPRFPALVFDDGAAVALNAILPLATQIGLHLTGADSVFGLLQNWATNLAALTQLVASLAHDDRARGHRGHFTEAGFLSPHAPIPQPRQVFSLNGGEVRLLAPTRVAGPRDQVGLSGSPEQNRVRIGLTAVFGRTAYRETVASAANAIAGFMVATDIGGGQRPGSLPTGPYLVPAGQAPPLHDLRGSLSLNGAPALADAAISIDLTDAVVALTREAMALPGDLLCLGFVSAPASNPAEDGDIIEAAIAGLGQQMTNGIRSA